MDMLDFNSFFLQEDEQNTTKKLTLFQTCTLLYFMTVSIFFGFFMMLQSMGWEQKYQEEEICIATEFYY